MTGSSNAQLREDLPRSCDWRRDFGINHVAIIPDGNRRWAKERSLPIELGHAKGLLDVMPDLAHRLSDAGVHTITVWGFSTENWNRDIEEVDHLMRLCVEFLTHRLLAIAERHGARIVHLGRKDRVSPKVLEALLEVERATAGNEDHVYNLAFDYGGRDELVRAGERMRAALLSGGAAEHRSIEDFLDTQGQPYPEPDLVIRTSGEQRLSGFMPWQAAYSEIFFVDRYFPDMDFAVLEGIAEQFRARKRRFGS
jgi:undecaprenyl diphosphate synthase